MPHAAMLLLAACPLLAALAGCGAAPTRETIASRAPTTQSLSVRGFIEYDGEIALPQDGFAIAELRDMEPPRSAS